MIQFHEIQIQQCIVHKVGNKCEDGGCSLSNVLVNVDEKMHRVLENYFIKSFINNEQYWQFSHISDIELNEVYSYVLSMFQGEKGFIDVSWKIASYLYECTTHPNVKSGDLYVVYIKECILDSEKCDAVGVFKSENLDTFIKVTNIADGYDVEAHQGININKLDKGCLIFNTKKDEGYVVAVVDNTNRSDAKYWVEDFLGVKPRQDKYFQTQNFMSVCKSFVTKQLPSEFEVSKADQADMLNRSVQYFKENDEFSIQDFAETVLEHPEVIESFQSYKERYQTERDIEIDDSFAISNDAVKKQARSFKSVIKLDKNFHIYVHGNRSLIEQGEDEKGRYYKVYYNEES